MRVTSTDDMCMLRMYMLSHLSYAHWHTVLHEPGLVITIRATWIHPDFSVIMTLRLPLLLLHPTTTMTTSRARSQSPNGAGPLTKKAKTAASTDYINRISPEKLQQYRETYKTATPYRHAVVKDFLSDELVRQPRQRIAQHR